MRATTPVFAAAAAILVLAIPAGAAFENSSWSGTARSSLKFKIVKAADNADRKFKMDAEQPGSGLTVATTSFSQGTGDLQILDGALAAVNSRKYATDEAGFETSERNLLRSQILGQINATGAIDVTFAVAPDLRGKFILKGPSVAPDRVKGKHILRFEGVIAGGTEDGKTVSGFLVITFDGTPAP